ncbi:hypothetical protein FACS189452_04730 [Bacteroidia bacterium]|nr:hypothetical protein FACS189452_04730 [Bacteroidia bacterium]
MGCAAGAAAATIAGTSIDWEMDADTLRMSGSGAMPTTWTASTQQPWNASRATIRAVVMQGAITTIGNYAFAAIPNLQCVDLSGLTDLTNIGAQAFFGCSALQAVDLPNGLRSIGNSAFEGCSGMMGEIKIPASVSSMGTRAFYSCSNVTSLVFETPSQLTVLPELAFYDMPLITHLVIPEGITTIGTGTGRVFEACLGLSTVSLPSTLQTISNKAFFGNEGLRTINFPPNLKTIGMSAFQNCSTLDAVQFPQGLTEIVEGAFMACSSMRGELRIPSSVTRISSSAFRAMDISSLVFDSPSELRTLSDLSFGDNKSLTKVELPEGLVELGSCSNSGGVFENCPALQHVTLPSTLTLIGKRAFYGNSLLSSVNFPQGLQTICDYAFYFCTGLTSIDLPDGLATIGNYAFNSCSGLQGELKLPASLSSLGPAAFSSCGSSSIKFFSPTLLEELPYNAFAFMPNLESLELPEGLKRIGPSTGSGNVFAQCEKLQTVNFPSTLKEINTEAFWRCRLLSSIHLPQGLETIGNYAFVQSGISSGMGDLVIPASVKKIGNYAFEGTLFTGLHFEQGSQLTTIGNYAFNSCTNLADINLPEGLLTIGNNAFVGTIASSLTIPQSVTAIGTNAFSGCNKLAVVTVKPPVPLTVNANVFANVTLANVQLVPPLANECAYATAPVWSGFKIEPAPCCPGAAGLTGISGSITWAFDCGEGKLTISRTAATGTVAMPTTYANATAQPWYKMRHRIRTVVIDSGVTTVGQYAFYGAVLLDSVSLPEGLTAVNASAFELCVALPRIAFPSTLTTLGSAALGAAAGLKKITMNAPYFDVAATVFTNTPLKPIELWLNTAAGNKADFYDHAVWSQMTIRNGCTDGQEVKRTGPSGTITWEVDYCTKTLTVHPPNGTTGRIPNYGTTAAPWYPYRAHIEKVVVQDGITTIGNNAFYGITTLLDARIESTQLDTICTGAFQNCPNLLSLYFASTADTIPKPIGYCFGNNTANDFVKAKVSVEVAPGKKCAYAAIPAWRDFYFKDTTRCCTGTVTSTTYDGVSWALHCGVLTISKSGTGVINNKSINEYPWYTHSAKIEKIVVAGGITMGNSAFKGYTALKEVEFEGTPIILGSETFSTCTRLRYVKGWQNVTSIGTSAFNGCTALEGPLNLRSVTALGQTAFTGCTGSLDTVYMPDSLTSWGNNSFQNASNMKTVIFPPIAKGTGYTAIPEYTFSACSKLSGKLTIPYGITAINRYAFYNHRLLDSVILPATLLTLGVSCFEGSNGTTGYQNMTQLKYVEFPSSLLTIQTKAFLDCNKLQGVLDLQSVTTFDEQCFNRCTGITGIKLGTQGHAITVGVSAFANCTGTTGSLNLTYVTNLTDNAFTNAAFTDTLYMPKVLLKWNTATLNGCNKVRYLVFPDTVVDYRSPAKTIPSQAFYNWPNLRGTVKIPIGIATIANSYAFANTQIDSVMFPVGFKTVGQLAFDACRNLKYVGFPPPNPAGAVAVGNYAFRNCANLQTPPDFTNVKSIGDYAFQNCEALTLTLIHTPTMPRVMSFKRLLRRGPKRVIIF